MTSNGINATVPVEIFRVGTHKPMNGPAITFTHDDLAKIVASYSEDRSAAPVVIGHPATDAPAYGWAKALTLENDKIVAHVGDLDPEFSEAVRTKRYAKVSAEFFHKTAPNNPTPGSYYLKHIGFLGAVAPAVTGLKRVNFSAAADEVLTFGGWQAGEMEAHYQRLLAEEQRDRAKEENERFIERLIDEGRVLPMHKENLLSFMDHLHGAGTFSFSEGGREVTHPAPVFLRTFLSQLPQVISFGEFDMGDPPDDMASSGFKAPDGYSTSPAGADLFNRASALARSKGISFDAALTELGA